MWTMVARMVAVFAAWGAVLALGAWRWGSRPGLEAMLTCAAGATLLLLGSRRTDGTVEAESDRDDDRSSRASV
jgi:hypothetical protein